MVSNDVSHLYQLAAVALAMVSVGAFTNANAMGQSLVGRAVMPKVGAKFEKDGKHLAVTDHRLLPLVVIDETEEGRLTVEEGYEVPAADVVSTSDAVEYYTGQIENEEELVSAYYYRSICQLYERRTQQAIDDVSACIAIDAEFTPAYKWRALLFMLTEKVEKAGNDYQRLIELHPEDPSGHLGMAKVLYQQLRFRKAIASADQAINLDDQNAESFDLRGMMHVTLDNHEEGLVDFRRAAELGSRNSMTYFYLGIAAEEEGSSRKAISQLSKALRLDPRNWRAYYARGRSYWIQKNSERANRDLTRAIELNPEEPAIYLARATVFNVSGEPKKAIADCTKSIELDPAQLEAYEFRAHIYRDQKQFAKAVEDLEIAIENDPTSLTARNSLAWLFCTCEDETCRDYERAVALAEALCNDDNFENGSYVDTLAAAYAGVGQYEKAVEMQQLAMVRKSDDEDFLERAEKRLSEYEEKLKAVRDKSPDDR